MYKWHCIAPEAFSAAEVLPSVSLSQYVEIFKEEGYNVVPNPQTHKAEFDAMIEDTGMDKASAKLLHEWLLLYITKKKSLDSDLHPNHVCNEGDEGDESDESNEDEDESNEDEDEDEDEDENESDSGSDDSDEN